MSRVVRGGYPDRAFDVEFWQAQGDSAIFDAARELVAFAAEFRGSDVELKADFKDLLRLLNQQQVRFLIVGGYAVMKYTEPFYTKDLDIWIEASSTNAERTYAALARFGAPLGDLSVEDLIEPETVFQIGMPPARIDILTSIENVEFQEAWERRVQMQWGDVPVSVVSLEHLIQNKEATGREMDKLQAERLRKYGRQA
jgi:hypothetical protein